MLAPAQPRHSLFVARVNDQVKSTQPFDGDDGAGANRVRRRDQRLIA
jgi:hypothetical protein